MRRTPASIRSGIRPASGRAVRRRSRVSRPRPLVRRSRGSSASVRGVRTTDVELGSTRSPPTARATDGRTRAPIGSSAQAGPSRAQPASVPTSTAAASATTTQPKPKTVAARAGHGQRREAEQRPAGLGQQDDAALPGARSILIRDRQDQPRREVDEHAEPERQRAEHEREPHARGRDIPARGEPCTDAAEPASMAGSGGRSGEVVHRRPLSERRPARSPVVIVRSASPGFPGGVEYRPCSHDAC